MASESLKAARGGRVSPGDAQLIQRRRAAVAALRLAGVRSAEEIRRALAEQGTEVGIRTIKYDPNAGLFVPMVLRTSQGELSFFNTVTANVCGSSTSLVAVGGVMVMAASTTMSGSH